jgi:hypothetical protein
VLFLKREKKFQSCDPEQKSMDDNSAPKTNKEMQEKTPDDSKQHEDGPATNEDLQGKVMITFWVQGCRN